jgi:HAD superfamily hydrolase (TIGR01509 family)
MEDYRSTLFKERYLPQVRGLPGVRELVQRIRANGQRVALGSSAKAEELRTYKKIAGIEDLTDEETSADDISKSKPHPDIFEAALGRLGGMDPSEAIVVGDSPYDAEAAGKIGMRTIGVLCGGFPEKDMRKAGCTAIYRDPAELLRRFDQSIIGLEGRPAERTRDIRPGMGLALGFAIAAVFAALIFRRRN